MYKGDTCFYKVRTDCGILKTDINAKSYGGFANKDFFTVNYIEFTNNSVMVGDDYEYPNVGGAPGKGMPFRSESFLFENDPLVSDKDRIVTQGRINHDTKTAGSKFWASYQQGLKKEMIRDTKVCVPRYTYLVINNAGSNMYNLDIGLEAVTILTSSVYLKTIFSSMVLV